MTAVGILGGTFNPPHLAHLVCASEARAQLELDEVMLVPTGIPPHKEIDDEPGAGALRDRDRCEPENRLRLLPARQRPGHVSSDDERQLVTWPPRIDLPKRIDRV